MNNKMMEMVFFSFGLLFLGIGLLFTAKSTDAMAENEAMVVHHSSTPSLASTSPSLLLDATTLTLTDGATVTTWNGQTATGSPIFLMNQTPNGQPAVAFDGSAHMGENVPIPVGPADDFVIAAVIKPDIINNYRNLIDDDASTRPMLWLDAGSRYEFNFLATAIAGNDPGGWDIVIADSKQGVVYLNDPANPLPAAAVAYATAKTFDLLNRDGSQMYQGLVAEFRVYTDKAGFNADFQALYTELHNKYIQGENSPPVNSVPGPQSVDEDIPLAINTIAVTDVDGNLATTQLSVVNGFINVSLAGGATISAGANGTNSLTLSGTEADINTALSSVVYQGNLNFNGSDVLTIISTDSSGTPLSDTDTVAITVNPINDAPVNNVPGAQSVDENTPLVISSIAVTDVDGNLATTQLSVMNGFINVTLAGSATISAGANGSNTLTLSGSQADINQTLSSAIYQGNLNFNGCDVLAVTSTDSAGTPLQDLDTITIKVDPPDLAVAPIIALINGGGTQAQLDWLPNAANCSYKVYRSTQPYTNYSLVATLPTGSSTYLAVPGTIGNVATNYFYYVAGINAEETHSAASNRSGEFDFAIIHE